MLHPQQCADLRSARVLRVTMPHHTTIRHYVVGKFTRIKVDTYIVSIVALYQCAILLLAATDIENGSAKCRYLLLDEGENGDVI